MSLLAYPFLHAGAMSIDFDQPYKGYMLDWIKVITKHYSLTGYISIDFKIFNNKLEILNLIKKQLPNNSFLMIKGSNSTGLNKIIKDL